MSEYGTARADEAMRAAMGDEVEPARFDPQQMTAKLLACEGPPDWEAMRAEDRGSEAYDQAATWAARMVYEWLLEDPRRAQTPSEPEIEWPLLSNGSKDYENPIYHQPGWYDEMKRHEDPRFDLSGVGLSGFQWGWAVNAARYCVELPPVPNPAIVVIEG